MKVKVALNKEIHITTVSSFQELKDYVPGTFQGELSNNWTLQYDGSDGQKFQIGNQKEYEDFESKSKGKTNKVYVVPARDVKVAPVNEDQQDIRAPNTEINENYDVIQMRPFNSDIEFVEDEIDRETRQQEEKQDMTPISTGLNEVIGLIGNLKNKLEDMRQTVVGINNQGQVEMPPLNKVKRGYLYFKNLHEKARKVQEIFSVEDFDMLCAYVDEAPEGLTIEELIANYIPVSR